MNRKSLAIGMIIPLAAASAVATAPAASARDSHHRSSISCDLSASRVHGGDIKVVLDVDSKGYQGRYFKVRIWQNGDTIVHRTVRDRDGDFKVRKYTDNERGTDWFKATVKNERTGDRCTDWVRVSGGGHHHNH